jgi:hypothetical protein
MTGGEKDLAVPTGNHQHIIKRMLNSMWGYWMFLLALSFGLSAIIYWVWLRGTV